MGTRGVELVTFGCRLNTYESEVMRTHAEQAGLADTVIVNTCAVTAEAERQARQAIRKLKRERPEARIVVTGCAAQIRPEQFSAMSEVAAVLGNEEKLTRAAWDFAAETERVRVNDIMSVRETAGHLVAGFEGRARAFVQVQNGCDHRCTFCIIPFGRGNSRSVAIGEIVAQVRALAENGYNEIVFTGVDITSYGADLPGAPSLGQMMRRVLALVPEVKRLRLSSLDPIEIDEDLWRLIAEEERLMPHLHLSVQAGDDMVLKRMKRRHARGDVIAATTRARALRPGIAFGADIIAGFPTETDEMAANTLALVEEAGLHFLHVFPYSERPGTPAARMPPVPVDVRRERARALREAGAASLARFAAAQIGRTARLVMETATLGRSEHFLEVAVPEGAAAGALVEVTLGHADADGRLTGHLTKRAA
jgi:threonylcarbamoyladenosine tRNA methylthiotransferase MtaB